MGTMQTKRVVPCWAEGNAAALPAWVTSMHLQLDGSAVAPDACCSEGARGTLVYGCQMRLCAPATKSWIVTFHRYSDMAVDYIVKLK